MLFIWILGILAALLLLLCLIRVGIRFSLHGGNISLDVKVGFLRFQLLPQKEKAKKNGKTKEMSADKKPRSLPLSKPALADIKEAVRMIAPPLKLALRRAGRGIRIHPLQVSLMLGGSEDPAAAAERYGYLHAGMWSVMPQAESLLRIPEPHLHIGLDFEASETVIEADIGVSARIGTLLSAAFTVGIPMIRWFMHYQKKQTPKAEKPDAVRT